MSGDGSASRSLSAGGPAGEGLEPEALLAEPGVAAALPGGTVTFAFTDIEDSTGLLQRLGEERYAALINQHRQILRSAFYSADGIEIDRQGDACFFALPRAKEAVRAAVEIQRRHDSLVWLDDLRVRVRIGLHTGEPSIGAAGYVGIDVVKGARICALARGGQILLSTSAHALTVAALPADVTAELLGDRQLKGINEPEPVYVLAIHQRSPVIGNTPSRPAIPAEWERQIEQRFGTVGAKLARSAGWKIAESLPRNAPNPTPAWKAVKSESLEQLATRAAHSLNSRLHSRTAAAMKKARKRPDMTSRPERD
jgi:class 3 adenylate cyclase